MSAAPTIPAIAVPQGPFAITSGGSVTQRAPNVPEQLGAVRIDNSSPFTLVVTAGQQLGQVGAFESHVFVLPNGATQPVTVLALAGSGVQIIGTDQSVYFTWYDVPPFGSWPSALGSAGVTATPTQQIANIPINVGGGGPGIQVAHLGAVLSSYHLSLALLYCSPGVLSAEAIFVEVTNLYGPGGTDPQQIIFQQLLIGDGGNQGLAPTAGVPTDVVVTIQPFDVAVNSTGNLLIFATPQPAMMYQLPLQPIKSDGNSVDVGATSSATIIGFPPIGFVYKVKMLTAHWGNVAAASGGSFRYATSGHPIADVGAPIGNQLNAGPGGIDLWVNDAITFTNSAAVTVRATIAYELWPLSYGFQGVPA